MLYCVTYVKLKRNKFNLKAITDRNKTNPQKMNWAVYLESCLGYPTALYAISIVFAIFLGWLIFSRRPSNLPPGPWGLPVVGNIFLFGFSPHRNVTKLAKQYGDVFSMKLGSRQVVILNTVDSVKEALVHRGSDFSGRPPLHTFLSSSHDGKTVAWPDFEPRYLKNKRATELAMASIMNDQNRLSKTVQQQAQITAQSLLNSRKSSFDPTTYLKVLATGIQFRMFFGDQMDSSYISEVQEVMDHSTDFIENSAVGNTVDFMPWVKVVFKKQVEKLDDSVALLMKLVRKIYYIRKRSAEMEFQRATNFTDSLAKAVADNKAFNFTGEVEHEETPHFDDETFINIIADNFGGGYEKLSTAFRWGVGYLVANREFQKRLQREIVRIKGTSPITLQDKPKLPLLEATVLEVFRMSCFLPFGLPHYTTRDTSVGGYKLSKGTIVFTNLWGCCRDAKYFENPNEFNPQRFLDKKSQKLVRSPCFLSFSAGDRKCPGDSYAKSVLFLVLGTLLQNVSLHNGTEEPIEEKFGLTIRPKAHKIRVERCT